MHEFQITHYKIRNKIRNRNPGLLKKINLKSAYSPEHQEEGPQGETFQSQM